MVDASFMDETDSTESSTLSSTHASAPPDGGASDDGTSVQPSPEDVSKNSKEEEERRARMSVLNDVRSLKSFNCTVGAVDAMTETLTLTWHASV